MEGWKEITSLEFAVLAGRHGSKGSEHPRKDGRHIVHQHEGRPFALQAVALDGTSVFYAREEDSGNGPRPEPPPPPPEPDP